MRSPPVEDGQGMVEYGLVIVLVAIVIFLVLTVFGSSVGNIYSKIISAL